jgi:Asp-tRNA(Asn)/Glu-tRNA(Gln) amidotransferase A subunit family amidase
LGTQTAGSVIRPASYCGILGFKPTHGAISCQGIKALSTSLDTVGVFAPSEEDLVLFWNVLVDGRWYQSARMRLPMRRTGPIRVALAELPESHLADDCVHAALEAMAGAIACVCHVGHITLSGPFEKAVDAHKTIMAVEAAGALDHEYRMHRAALGQQVLTMIEEGRQISRESYEKARRVQHECTSALAAVCAQHNALFVPSATGEPPMGLASTGDPVLCRAWSLVGCPAASVPVACAPSGAPIGLQLVGAPGRDEGLLAVLLRIAPKFRSAPARASPGKDGSGKGAPPLTWGGL